MISLLLGVALATAPTVIVPPQPDSALALASVPVTPASATPSVLPLGPRLEPIGISRTSLEGAALDGAALEGASPADSGRPRPHAIEYSDAYFQRLTVHRIASYAELPLFATEYVLGERLLRDERTGYPPSALKASHAVVAGGLGVLFAVNTVTGAWNLWDSRADPSGRTLRIIHSVAMLGADAGFAWAGASATNARNSQADAQHHRNISVGSMALATAGTAIMWLFHD